jgi:hypothetical protein
MAAVKSYTGAEVSITIAGITITGTGDGTFLTISRNNPAFTDGTGTDGEGWRAKSTDKSGTAVITVLQTSQANDLLSALAAADEATGDGVGALLVKDLSGRSLFSAETAWIEKYADSEFARDKSEREWTLKTNELLVFVGGN